jgi:hypothetical protein
MSPYLLFSLTFDAGCVKIFCETDEINSNLCVKTGAAIGAELAFPSGGRWHGVSRDG